MAEKCTRSNISFNVHTMETFLSFSVTNFDITGINLTFIDSYKHLASSLDSLLNKDTNIQSIKTKSSSIFQYFKDDAINY